MLSKWFEAEDYITSKHIVTVVETKIDATTTDTSINPKGCFINRADRNRFGGGIITYVNPALQPSPLETIQTKYCGKGLEITITRVKIAKLIIVVLGVYRPPNAIRQWFEEFRDLILEVTPYGKLILMGDLNCDLLKPDSPSTRLLLTILELGNIVLKAENKLDPTRVTFSSASCLDFIAVDWSLDVSRYEVSDLLLSDHHPVETDLDITFNPKITPIVKRSFKNVDINQLGLKLSEIRLENVNDPLLLDSQVQQWNQEFVTILDNFAPLRNFPRTRAKPIWVDNNTRGLMRLRKSMSKKAKSGTLNPEEWVILSNLKRCVKSRIRASVKNHGQRILAKNEPKETWKFIKKMTFTQIKGPAYLPDIDEINNFFGTLVSSDTQLPYNGGTQVYINRPALDVSQDVGFNILPLDCGRTEKLLRKVKANSATGPDDIPAFLVKKTSKLHSSKSHTNIQLEYL